MLGKRKGEWWELPIPHESWELRSKNAFEAVEPLFPIPRKLWGRLLSQGGIRLQINKLMLHLFPAETVQFMQEYGEIELLYEDDFCLVANKPAGMPVHPTESGQGGSLANRLAYYYQSSGQSCAVRHIHRLDRDTTGAVLYAKNEMAHLILDEAMREKKIERRYAALAEGTFRILKGAIREPIGRDRHHSGKRRVAPSGDDAVTHYTVREQFKKAAFVQLQLETGRTHQIRVHLSHMGHPLIGDALYGGSLKLLNRQALHGEELLFHHPVTGEMLIIHAPWPSDLLQLLATLRA
jgi:23S rRNA pseudouridine1911/1915/1917 synthase